MAKWLIAPISICIVIVVLGNEDRHILCKPLVTSSALGINRMDKLSMNREKEFAEKVGCYGLVIRVSNPIVNPGERLEIEVYVSGYGKIERSKLVVYPSPLVFDADKSSAYYGLKKKGDVCGFGGERKKLDPAGLTITIPEVRTEDGKTKTFYFDSSKDEKTSQIATEKRIKLKGDRPFPPFLLDLAVRKDAKPGPQSIQCLFTYFNGESWANSSETAQFTVRNFYQRHEITVWVIGGIIGTIGTIIAIILGVKDLIPIVKKIIPRN